MEMSVKLPPFTIILSTIHLVSLGLCVADAENCTSMVDTVAMTQSVSIKFGSTKNIAPSYLHQRSTTILIPNTSSSHSPFKSYRHIPSCDLCGVEISWIKGELYSYDGYSCSSCGFNLCLICSRKPPPLTIEHPMFHEHPLLLTKDETDSDDEYFRDSGLCVFIPRCKACNKSIY